MASRLMERTLSWVEKVLESGGHLVESGAGSRGNDPWFGATIDTRSECTNRVFFALRGERTDGHRFVEEARSKGCSAVVLEDKSVADALARSGSPYFLVRSALEALQELSRAYRSALDTRVIAVTGSMGKTTTREYIRGVLRKKYRVHSNPGNLNNHIGVPLTLLDTDQDDEYLVCEIGANHAGEIEFLSRLLRPDAGVVTNIGDAHIGYFGSREKIAEAKSEIFLGIDPDGYAVLPADDEYFELLREKALCRVVTFGRSESSTYRISGVRGENGRIRFEINGEPVMIESVGEYNAMNAVAAYAVGELCGVEVERIREALGEIGALSRRSKVYRGRGIVLIDDSYNANPTSMRAALESFGRLAAGRRIAVLGDMAELGDFSGGAHRELGAFVATQPVDALWWFGENAELVEEGFETATKAKTSKKFGAYTRTAALIEDLKKEIRPGDAVLVKASRACHLDEVVDVLVESVLGQEAH